MGNAEVRPISANPVSYACKCEAVMQLLFNRFFLLLSNPNFLIHKDS